MENVRTEMLFDQFPHLEHDKLAAWNWNGDIFVIIEVPYLIQNTTTSTSTELDTKKRVVVIGNGMVGQRFLEKVLEDTDPEDVQLSTFCEEPSKAGTAITFLVPIRNVWLCTRYRIFEN